MKYQDITKSLKINVDAKIGTVILFVEGQNEIDLFDTIFRFKLHYKTDLKYRHKKNFKKCRKYVSKKNVNSMVFIVNLENSNIKYIKTDEKYRDALYTYIYDEYDINPTYARIYYIWDRDKLSNDSEDVLELVSTLTNSQENENHEPGLLLLSYPASEAYVISHFEKHKNKIDDNLKDYVKRKGYHINDITKDTLIKATKVMIEALKKVEVKHFDINNIKNINLKVYNKEEQYCNDNKCYLLLSLISIMFLDLKIIDYKEKK